MATECIGDSLQQLAQLIAVSFCSPRFLADGCPTGGHTYYQYRCYHARVRADNDAAAAERFLVEKYEICCNERIIILCRQVRGRRPTLRRVRRASPAISDRFDSRAVGRLRTNGRIAILYHSIPHRKPDFNRFFFWFFFLFFFFRITAGERPAGRPFADHSDPWPYRGPWPRRADFARWSWAPRAPGKAPFPSASSGRSTWCTYPPATCWGPWYGRRPSSASKSTSECRRQRGLPPLTHTLTGKKGLPPSARRTFESPVRLDPWPA